MSQYDKPIRDINPIDYLRDFINTSLILTFEEERILNYLQNKQNNTWEKKPIIKSERTILAKQGFKRCKVCGQIFEFSEFYKHYGVCRYCTQEIRRQKRLEQW